MAQVPKVRLNNGLYMPGFGLGTFESHGEAGRAAKHAIDIGYRHFDTAEHYHNEAEVGKAIQEKIKEGAVKREDIFIVTKLWNTDHDPEEVEDACRRSIAELGLGYIDLYLMHYPTAYKKTTQTTQTTQTNGVNVVEPKNGLNGVNGVKGVNGINEKSKINGLNGVNDMNGVNGLKGVNGKSKVNGLNGVNGANDKTIINVLNEVIYTNGTNRKNGINGLNGKTKINGLKSLIGENEEDYENDMNGINVNGVNGINGKGKVNGLNGVKEVISTNGTNGVKKLNGLNKMNVVKEVNATRSLCGTIEYSDVDYIDTWKAMERLVDLGLVKSIGVSNFNSEQIERLLANCRIKPVNNQIECSPQINQKKLIKFCRDRDIVITSYCPLGRPIPAEQKPAFLYDNKLSEIAKKYNKSPAQIVFRYLIDVGTVPIPKSVTPSRIEENVNIFDFKLTADEVKYIDTFHTGERVIHFEKARNHKYFPFAIEF